MMCVDSIASICLELDVLSALPIHKEASVLIPDDQARYIFIITCKFTSLLLVLM